MFLVNKYIQINILHCKVSSGQKLGGIACDKAIQNEGGI